MSGQIAIYDLQFLPSPDERGTDGEGVQCTDIVAKSLTPTLSQRERE
jgi:hypothetical protein